MFCVSAWFVILKLGRFPARRTCEERWNWFAFGGTSKFKQVGWPCLLANTAAQQQEALSVKAAPLLLGPLVATPPRLQATGATRLRGNDEEVLIRSLIREVIVRTAN
jgi:hypothetical protein